SARRYDIALWLVWRLGDQDRLRAVGPRPHRRDIERGRHLAGPAARQGTARADVGTHLDSHCVVPAVCLWPLRKSGGRACECATACGVERRYVGLRIPPLAAPTPDISGATRAFRTLPVLDRDAASYRQWTQHRRSSGLLV